MILGISLTAAVDGALMEAQRKTPLSFSFCDRVLQAIESPETIT